MEAQARARELRTQGMTLSEIATSLGVSKSSVSVWVRDVEIEPRSRRPSTNRRPHRQHLAKLAEIAESDCRGYEQLGTLSEQAFLAAGAALYAGEGAKRDGKVVFANTDPLMIAFFCAWLPRFFSIDESRLRVRVYLHEGLDLVAAEQHWASITSIRRNSFKRPIEQEPILRSDSPNTNTAVRMWSTTLEDARGVMGLIRALLSSPADPG